MKLFAPKYYKDFSCIAHRCLHSCCIGWEIDIDEDTMARYASAGGYGKRIAESIEPADSPLEMPHFRLGEGERCPHLTENGLCRIITELGESYLCHICREHPRFYHDTARGREVGLGMACEEACRLILSSDTYADFVEVGQVCGEPDEYEFDALSARERVWAILSSRAVSYLERLNLVYGEFEVSPHDLPDEEWREVLSSLEYLNEEHRSLFSVYTSAAEPTEEWEPLLERALAYFVYRHCSEAEDEDSFRCSLGFCLFCERLLASMAKTAESREALAEMARIISEELEYSEENTEAIRFEFF